MTCRLVAIAFALVAHALMAEESGYIYAGLGENNSAEKPAGKQYFPCGPTGIRAEITVDRPTEFLVRYVFDDCPATGKVLPGDRIVGANGKVWKQKDQVRRTPGAFEEGGYEGPRLQLGMAVEDSEGTDGKLSLIIIRDGKEITVDLKLKRIGRFSETFPYHCKKTETIVKDAAKFLDDKNFIFRKAGYWYRRYMPAVGLIAQGDPEGTVRNYYVPLLADKYKKDYSDDPVPGEPREWTWDMAMEGITLAECYLYTKEKRLLPRMEWLNRWYATGAVANGGFCHKHGQSGYGTMTTPTAWVCAAWALFKECGVEIDEAAYMRSRWILDACTLPNGDFEYSTKSRPNPEKGTWTSGRPGECRRFAGTAYAAVYHYLDPCERYSGKYVERVVESVAESKAVFPDGHASGISHVWGGFLAARLAAEVEQEKVYREVLDYYKYWLNVNRNPDGSFTLPPGRDRVTSADPGMDTRYDTTGAVLLFLSGPKRNLAMLGKGTANSSAGKPNTTRLMPARNGLNSVTHVPAVRAARMLDAEHGAILDNALKSALVKLGDESALTPVPISLSLTRVRVCLKTVTRDGTLTLQIVDGEKTAEFKWRDLKPADRATLALLLAHLKPDSRDAQAMAGVYLESLGKVSEADEYYGKAGEASRAKLEALLQ